MSDRLTWIGRTDSGVVRQRLYDRDIHTLLLSPLDPGRKAWDVAIRKEGGQTGRFIDPHWFNLASDGNALAFRRKCDEACAELQGDEMLMVDLEQVSMDYVRRLFQGSPGNRGLYGSQNPNVDFGTQAGRQLAYTNEPFKNHTVVPFDVFKSCPTLTWWPQGYYGGMQQADMAAIVLEILRDYDAWVAAADGEFAFRVHPFYDGKLIATDQRDGGWFTAERIPGVFNPSARLSVSSTEEYAREILRPDIAFMSKDSLRAHYTQLAAAA